LNRRRFLAVATVMVTLSSFDPGGVAVVVGASGGIGAALCDEIQSSGRFAAIERWSRSGKPAVDLVDEASIAAAARRVAEQGLALRLVIVASGVLHEDVIQPEKSWRAIDPETMARSFAINAIGPMLVAKHLLPLLPRTGRSVFAVLSARVGSIGDNRLGGWYGYRASKAALNQLLRTASIELGRTHKDAVCLALHPGTVETGLSAPFRRADHPTSDPATAARQLLEVIDAVQPDQTGSFLAYDGSAIPW
jgi:NAD(P)-dependent dehydrogenase (short-subunit alcohol dehydrogenase family)